MGGFNAGRGLASPGSDQDAGGANLAKPLPTTSGHVLNKGRLSGGREVHHNGGTASIAKGSTNPPR